jgi:hypothetical protein
MASRYAWRSLTVLSLLLAAPPFFRPGEFTAWLHAADAASVTVKGYVLDSACAFTKNLDKPISKQCAVSCAKAGSPLVILAEDGTIYWPIAATTPSASQNPKLLPFAGERVTVVGKVYDRSGSKAIVIEKIEPQK